MPASTHKPRNPRSLAGLNVAFGAAGPLLLVLIYVFLPLRNVDPAGPVRAEAVGVLAAAATAQPLFLGYGEGADLRLPGLSGLDRAAVLYPPERRGGTWRAASASPHLVVGVQPAAGAEGAAGDSAHLLPWKEREPYPLAVRGDGFLLRIVPATLYEVSAPVPGEGEERVSIDVAGPGVSVLRRSGTTVLSCPEGGRPRFLAARGVPAPAPPAVGELCARLPADGDATWRPLERCGGGSCYRDSDEPAALVSGPSLPEPWLVRAGAEPLEVGPLWIRIYGEEMSSLRLSFRPAPLLEGRCPGARECTAPPRLEVRDAGSDADVGALGPAALTDGHFLSIDGRTLLARRDSVPHGAAAPLSLLYTRKPRAVSVMSTSSTADLYHPAGRVLWHVPPCAPDTAPLRLVVGGAAQRGSGPVSPAAGDDAAELDRRFGRVLEETGAGLRPAPRLGGVRDGVERSFRLCHRERRGGTMLAVTTERAGGAPPQDPGAFDLGTPAEPREALVPLGSILLRAARGGELAAERRTRRGVFGFLLAMSLLQAGPLSLSRGRRAKGLHRVRRDPVWRSEIVLREPGAASTLQLCGAVVGGLLLVGATYQLALAADPRLVGIPDYVQAFLQATVYVGMILAAAAWSTLGGTPGKRLGYGSVGAGAAAGIALLWWLWDATGLPAGLAVTRERSAAHLAAAEGYAWFFAQLALAGLVGPFLVAILVRLAALARRWHARRRGEARPPRPAGWREWRGWRTPWVGVGIAVVGGCAVAVARTSALGLELGLLAALAWYTASQWDFVVGDAVSPGAARSPESRTANLTGWLLVGFVFVFLWRGSKVPLWAGYAAGITGMAGYAAIWWYVRFRTPFRSLHRLLAVWTIVTAAGVAACALVMSDVGSLAAWLPALVCGFLLWAVRPEEPRETAPEMQRSLLYLLLTGSAGLLLLGVLGPASQIVAKIDSDALARPRQRVVLAQDVSYLSAGEWITQVRWLASRRDEAVSWVANLNSDVALFGVASVFGSITAVLASLGVIVIAGCLAWTADQALRQGWIAEQTGYGSRGLPTRFRAVGLFAGMTAFLLLAQWLVHLTTGVDLRYPITGLVLPWISHGNTSHLLLTAAIALPLAVAAGLEEAVLDTTERAHGR